MTTPITTFNGRISTEAWLTQYADCWNVTIAQHSNNGETDILQTKQYKTLKNAQRYIDQYRACKKAAFEKGELNAGVEVL